MGNKTFVILWALFGLCIIGLIYFGLSASKQRQDNVTLICESHGYFTNNYSISQGKTSETVMFCVDSKGVMYWPGALEAK